MADIPNRDELERQLARTLGRLQRSQMARLLEYMGDPPSLERVPPEFWDEIGGELADALRPFLGTVYTDAAQRMIEAGPVGIEWALINQRAADWARQYTFELVKGINEHTRDALQHAVSGYFEQGQTIGELEEQISGLFGAVRAEMISVTEVTRAAAEGERGIADELRKEGIDMVPVWQTNNDELVCPQCGPRHNQVIKDGIYPPYHPRCRCWAVHELPKVRA